MTLETIHLEYEFFRKELQNYELLDSLYVIWAYSRNFDYNFEFPKNIEVSTDVKDGKGFEKRARSWLEFEFEYFVKEIIINCSQSQLILPKSFKKERELALIVNRSRKFREYIDSTTTTPENVLLEFNRLAHQQFKWQTDIVCKVVRYYKIYSEAGLNSIILKRFGISALYLYKYTIAVNVTLSKYFKVPKSYFFNGKYKDYSEKFLTEFTSDLVIMRSEMISFNKIDKDHFFNYNPIISRPILVFEDEVLCPIPKLILLKLTDGLFFLLSNEKEFGQLYGKAFEKYVGEIISVAVNDLQYFGEMELTKNIKSTDWHIHDTNSLLFIECKAKRPRLASKSQTQMTEEWSSDLEKLTLALKQCADSYNKYINGYYSNLKQRNLKPYFMVITLEDWFVELNDMTYQLIKSQLISKLKQKYPYIEEIEFAIISIERFETIVESINTLGIADFVKKRLVKSKNKQNG